MAGLMACLLAVPAMAAEPQPAPMDPALAAFYKQQETDNIELALSYLTKNPEEARRRFSAEFLAQAQQALESGQLDKIANGQGPTIVVGKNKQVVMLQSDYNRLAELGAAVGARQNRGNLLQQYKLAYGLAPAHVQQLFPEPPTLWNVETARLMELVDFILADIRDISTVHYLPGVLLPPSQAMCEAEKGYEDGTDQDAGSCAGYAVGGIMRNVSFPLRDDLTCVKNQGQRGTCVAFGSTAAIETGVHVMNGNKVNLSEQHAYWYGETTVGVNGRYTYGLTTSDYVDELESSGYQLPREKIWNYNPSWNIGAFSGNSYPNSCVGYFGEKCTDFAFQADELLVAGPVPFFLWPDPMPNAAAFGVAQAVSIGTDAAGLNFAKSVLDSEIPLVVAIDVTPSFRNPDANGYVTFLANEVVSGGHAVHVAGWIENADLPAGAPSGSGGGYFVLKNSWGESVSDCGYYYVPFDFLLTYGRSLTSVEVD